jgi:hypothetical protein
MHRLEEGGAENLSDDSTSRVSWVTTTTGGLMVTQGGVKQGYGPAVGPKRDHYAGGITEADREHDEDEEEDAGATNKVSRRRHRHETLPLKVAPSSDSSRDLKGGVFASSTDGLQRAKVKEEIGGVGMRRTPSLSRED